MDGHVQVGMQHPTTPMIVLSVAFAGYISISGMLVGLVAFFLIYCNEIDDEDGAGGQFGSGRQRRRQFSSKH